MIRRATHRIVAVMHRYGTAAEMAAPGTAPMSAASLAPSAVSSVRVLINDFRPLRHPDLPNQVIGADGLLLAAADVHPEPGCRLMIGTVRWMIETVAPVALTQDSPDAGAGDRLFEIQVSQAVMPA